MKVKDWPLLIACLTPVFVVLTIWITAKLCIKYRDSYWREHFSEVINNERKTALQTASARMSQMEESQRAYFEMKVDVDDIALFIRENYKDEMGRGWHSGRRLGDIVTGYLAVERQYQKAGREFATSERRAAL